MAERNPRRETDVPVPAGEGDSEWLTKQEELALQFERAVIGCMLMDADAARFCANSLEVDDFLHHKTRLMFAAARALIRRGMPVDPVGIVDLLKRERNQLGQTALDVVGGHAEVVSCLMDVFSLSNVDYYCRCVRNESTKRKLYGLLASKRRDLFGVDGNTGEFISGLSSDLRALLDRLSMGIDSSDAASVVERVVEEIEASAKSRKPSCRPVPSGIPSLDAMLGGGFWPGQLIVIGARPSVGKSVLLSQFALQCGFRDKGRKDGGAVMISLEMMEDELIKRILAQVSGIPLGLIIGKAHKLSEEHLSAIRRAKEIIAQANVRIHASMSSKLMDIEPVVRKAGAAGASLILIDYLQLIKGPRSESRNQELSEITRSLKMLAMQCGCPIVVASQLNRSLEQRGAVKPRLSDLRDSGSIEQDADVVIFPVRAEDESEDPQPLQDAELVIAKHRNGPVGSVRMKFCRNLVEFIDAHDEESIQWALAASNILKRYDESDKNTGSAQAW